MNISDYFDLGSVDEIPCLWSYFDKYELQVIDNKKYLIVKSDPTVKGLDDVGIKKLDILFATIRLGSMLSSLPINPDMFERHCTDSDIKLILEWCYRFGAPFIENLSTRTIDKNGFINEKISFGFRIGDFYVGIAHLCDTFLHWERIYRNNIAKSKENRFLSEDIDEAKFALQYSFLAYSHTSIFVSYNGDQPVFKIVGKDLIDVPFIQLALLISSPDGEKIRRCKICNALFKAHGRSEYCEQCNRQNAYRIQRKRSAVNILYDKEYHRLYHLYYMKKLSEDEFYRAKKTLNEKRNSLKGFNEEKAVEEFSKWIIQQKHNKVLK